MILTNTYFSGAGLMDWGLSEGGLTIQQSFELDEMCCQTQRKNFTHEVKQIDITSKLVAAEKSAPVRIFTYPCNEYSTSADLHGTRRGGDLYLHAMRHVVIDPPEIFSAENVPGMLKFPVVMEIMTKLPGYFVTVICPVSTQTWLPQRRDRVIIIGSRKNFYWRSPQSARRQSLRDILEPEPQLEIPDYFYRRLAGKYRDQPIISDPARDDIAPTCVAHYAKDRSTRAVRDKNFPKGIRPYTVREYARLQGLPDSFQFAGTESDAYRQIGNGVSIPVGRWLGQEITRYFKN